MVKVRQHFIDFGQELRRTKLEFELAIETAKVDDGSSSYSSQHQATDFGFPRKATTNMLAMDKTVAVADQACQVAANIDIDVLALQELYIKEPWIFMPDFLEEIKVYFEAASTPAARCILPSYQLV